MTVKDRAMDVDVRIEATVLPGGRIELQIPQLREGERVEVLVRPETPRSRRESMLDFLRRRPAPPGAFATPEAVDTFLRAERNAWER